MIILFLKTAKKDIININLDVVTRYYRAVAWAATRCRLEIALLESADVDLSLHSVDWRGSSFYNLHTSVNWRDTGMALWCWPTKKLCPAAAVVDSSSSAWTERMLCGQSTDQTMHVLVCWKVRRRPATDWLYIQAFQMTVPEIIIASPHCFFVWSILASNAWVRRAFVHEIVWSLDDAISQCRRISEQISR